MIAELFVATELAKRDYIILWPQGTQTRYDFAIEKGGVFDRIQVKKATWSTNPWYKYLQARISSRNKGCSQKYTEGEFEYFAFTDLERVWLFPFEVIGHQTSVCLDSSNPNYKPKTVYNAKDWLL